MDTLLYVETFLLVLLLACAWLAAVAVVFVAVRALMDRMSSGAAKDALHGPE